MKRGVHRVRSVLLQRRFFLYAGVAQLAVHAICNREVAGSTPVAGSTLRSWFHQPTERNGLNRTGPAMAAEIPNAGVV